MSPPRRWVEALGGATLALLGYLGGLALLAADTIRHVLVGPLRGRPVRLKELWSQMVRVGPRSRILHGAVLTAWSVAFTKRRCSPSMTV